MSLNDSAQLILRSDSKNHLDMSKTVDLAIIGNALIAQTRQLEQCFQNSMMSSETSEVEDFSLSINTLGRLISQLTVSDL